MRFQIPQILLSILCFRCHESAYILDSNHSGATFFDGFYFMTYSNGFANYIGNETEAFEKGLIQTSPTVQIRVDSTNVATDAGRDSIFIQTQKGYTSGLFILDAQHAPFGCTGWPAFWTVGADWPNGGEIDVMEQLDKEKWYQINIHHADGVCTTYDPVVVNDVYGDSFNNNGGGVWAMEWKPPSVGIRVWSWVRANIPKDITDGKPDPNTWGQPRAWYPFNSSCPSTAFSTQWVILNIQLCGWASSFLSTLCKIEGLSTDCNTVAKNNPKLMKNLYWEINSLTIYQETNATEVVKRLNDSVFRTRAKLRQAFNLTKLLMNSTNKTDTGSNGVGRVAGGQGLVVWLCLFVVSLIW